MKENSVAENPKGVEMSSSKSRDYRAQVIYLFFVALSVMNFNSAIRAGDKEEEKTGPSGITVGKDLGRRSRKR